MEVLLYIFATVFGILAIVFIPIWIGAVFGKISNKISNNIGIEKEQRSKPQSLRTHRPQSDSVGEAEYKDTNTDRSKNRNDNNSGIDIIFLSYRRNDSADVSGRIYDRLASKYGRKNVFKDVDSMPLGVDCREHIDQMVSKATVFLIVIGPGWLGEKEGYRRIDEPRDFVRLEVQAALNRGIPVIPLLVSGGSVPSEEDLPDDIKLLAYRNGVPIRSDPDFNNDMARLLSGLANLSNQAFRPMSGNSGGASR